MSTYARQPIAFDRGEGVWLWDTEGNRYLDAVAGIAVCGLGHAHPAITEALCEQAGRLVHTSNLYRIEGQAELGARLCALAGMETAFFCNSGAEANETALKLARLHGHAHDIDHPKVVVMKNGFHGRTLATLSATANPKVRAGFEPYMPGFQDCPFDDIETLRTISRTNPDIVALLLEPIQGEGGIRIPADGYLKAVRALCDERGYLMMVDEIQTGMGRTGQWFGQQHEACRPDVITLAKALGNGVPIGACLARDDAASAFSPGSHGTTFGGNPLACRAGLTVIDTIEHEQLLFNAANQGEYLLHSLRNTLGDCDVVREIRGQGLMIGIELHHACGELVARARASGVLINVTADNVIRLLPPLILSRQEADRLVDVLTRLIRASAPIHV